MDKPARTGSPLVRALQWVLHVAVICALLYLGRTLWMWLIAQWSQPIQASDISEEWWEIFRRFAATLQVAVFLALSLTYMILIRPGRG